MSDDELVEQFIKELYSIKNYSENTISGYKKDIDDFRTFIETEGYNTNLLKIRNNNIPRSYVTYLSKNKYAPASIKRKISSLSSFYEYLVKEELVRANYFTDLDNMPKKPKPHINVIKNEEIKLMLDACDLENKLGLRNYCLLGVLYGCGLRVSELCNMKILDIDFSNRTIHVHGKGSKDRIVVMLDWLPEVLKEYLSTARIELLYFNKNVEDERYVFLNKNGTQLTRVGVRKILEGMVANAGDTFHISPHMIRHSFATEMLNGGMNLREIQALLGHESLSTTQIYTNVSYVEMKKAFEASHPRAKAEYKKKSE